MAKVSAHKTIIDDDAQAKIVSDIAQWHAGKWATVVQYGPACCCGLRSHAGICYRHPWAHLFLQPVVTNE